MDALGNKALLEKRVNIRAADYRFHDKKKYYEGFTVNNGKSKEGTEISELKKLVQAMDDFTENDIKCRTEEIIDAFVEDLANNNLLK